MRLQLLQVLQPQSLVLRRALSAAFGIGIAVMVDYYFGKMQMGWVPLIALIMMQMPIRVNLRLALQRFIVIIISVAAGSIIAKLIHDQWITNILLVTTFILACYLHDRYAGRRSLLSIPLIVAIIAMILFVPALETPLLYARMHDVILGGVVGIVSGLLIYPSRADVDFRIGVIVILRAYQRYLLAITDLLFLQSAALASVQASRLEVERVLQIHRVFFPDWVYEAGFNIALRQGHRHFLVRTEQVGEILCALQSVARHPVDPALLDKLRQPILHSVKQTVGIIDALITLLELKKLTDSIPDFAEDMHALEALFHKTVALPLELLDISQDYVYLAAFIYDIKDLQKTLLKLAEALR